MSVSTCAVIPARMHSTRLPGKMLLRATGRSLVQHTYESACRAESVDRVLVATDHPEIADEVERFGGEAVMTREDHQSGADRVAEVAAARPEFDLFVNVQGDEPEIEPAAIDAVVAELTGPAEAAVATAATPIVDAARVDDPNLVKVVCDNSGRALYFSRSPIPFVRDGRPVTQEPLHLQHLGLYAYRRDFLLRLPELPASRLEEAEKLEQLRMLAAGETIRVAMVDRAAAGIDTREDYDEFVARFRAG